VLRGLFVTGTDTGVGKTVAAAALVHRCRGQFPVRYWKPIQTGIEQDDDTAEVTRLAACSSDEILTSGVRLERPVSPHLAAKLAGTPIDVDALIALVSSRPGPARWIVEGAGGVLVPVGEQSNIADLISRLGLPAVVIARTALGTINHTLLTIEALRSRSILTAGVIMVGAPNRDNRDAIERYGCVEVLGEMPRFESLNAGGLAAWATSHLDRNGRLESLLR
jgi:malonyl-CoA O-methyltransferase